jgi:diaminohydroxyphosphoribosylaminopyrimidine deaminase/5-amino-6-(5-phosphoribosylamino)uracil reductase
MSQDEIHLRRAIRLAMNGRGLVEPNPMVGCVIVKHDRIIGEGFHQQYGHPHAEPNALASCTESPEGSTAYVTLEPCCHTNKQTPPCAPRLIAAKISRVVIGCLDPNPDVNGKGVKQLREAGVIVDGPLLEAECKQLIAPFIRHGHDPYTYITMKWAESADGKIAGPGGKRIQISNPASTHQVQLLRSRSDLILIGINTAINDDPLLLPRGVSMLRPYYRVVADSSLRLPLYSQLVKSADRGPVVVISHLRGMKENPGKLAALRAAGVEVTSSFEFNRKHPEFSHTLIEAGPTLAKGMIDKIERLWVIRSPKVIGDSTAPSAAVIPDWFVQTGELNLDGDTLCEYLNTRSDVFFTSTPSADFVLASGK